VSFAATKPTNEIANKSSFVEIKCFGMLSSSSNRLRQRRFAQTVKQILSTFVIQTVAADNAAQTRSTFQTTSLVLQRTG
jgi:hypothetical protein